MRHTARSLALRARLRSKEEDGAEREQAQYCAYMRGKWSPIMFARGELRHRDGLPRILVEIMIDLRYSPICRLANKFRDTDVFANRFD